MTEHIIDKGFGKGIKISLNEYKGKKFLQIGEVWKTSPEDKEWKFSKKNITFNSKTIDEFFSVLEKNKNQIYSELSVKPAEVKSISEAV